MPILDPLILAADVSITPTAKLSPSLRARLGAKRGDYAVARLRGRAPARLIGRLGASLLAEFLEAKPVATAVIACAERLDLNPDALLEEAFPLLRDCFNSRFLVVAGSPEAARTLPTRDRGDTVGRFVVLRCLHVVDDTELYQARDRDGAVVAVKLARPGVTSGALFTREAAVLRHLDGNGAPALIGSGRHAERPWLAMSWCTGIAPDVAFAELRSGAVADATVKLLDLATRIARAYAGIHQAGVLHGDVHDRNLLIDRRDAVHLLDFGLARAIAPLRLGGRARRGAVPQFLAPEQAASVLAGGEFPAPTAASEQYAVATLLYSLVVGAHPIELALDRETMLQQIVSDPPLLFARRGTAPWPELEAVFARALAKRPQDRFRSMTDLARALARVPRTRRADDARRLRASRTSLDGVVSAFLARVDYAAPAFRKAGRAPTCSIMLGRAGVAYALYRLACLRDDARTLALADAWMTRVERDSNTAAAFAAPTDGLDAEGLGPVSPFHSITGVHVVRALIALAMNDADGAVSAIGRFTTAAGIPWPSFDLTLGRMGVPLACATLIEALPATMSEQIDSLQRAGGRVMTELWREIDRFGPIGRTRDPADFGIAHGWAGLLYATLRWHRATGQPLPSAMQRRLVELADAAESLGRGIHWPQQRAGLTPSVLGGHQVAGWCNGPAGFVHLWTVANVHFPRRGFGVLAEGSAWSAWESDSVIFDLCCGLVGRAHALLNLYRHTGQADWLDRAATLAHRAAEVFERCRSMLPRPLSLFKGEAGLALLFAELRHPEAAAFPLFEPEGFPRHATHG